VIGIASTDNLEYLKQLGADEVIDYRTQKFEDLLSNVDVVLEASPNRDNNERIKAIRVLKEGGIFVTVNTDFPFNDELLAAAAQRKVKAESAANQPRQEWLATIAQLIDQGKVKVYVNKVFPLAEVAEAHRESETWHVRGKLVLKTK
jgi:NADPH:quinone reductase-like Zn-dependent oxidoreductase